jgi:hypothetical protein
MSEEHGHIVVITSDPSRIPASFPQADRRTPRQDRERAADLEDPDDPIVVQLMASMPEQLELQLDRGSQRIGNLARERIVEVQLDPALLGDSRVHRWVADVSHRQRLTRVRVED